MEDSGSNIIASVVENPERMEEEREGTGGGREGVGKEEVSSRSREEEATSGIIREEEDSIGVEDVRPMGEEEETSTAGEGDGEGKTAAGEEAIEGTEEEEKGEGEGEDRMLEDNGDIPGVLVEGDTSVVDSV